MRLGKRSTAVLLMAALLSLGLVASAGWGLGLGDILKVGGIAWLVSQYGDQIDKFIGSALNERQAQINGATKVVPILSVGQGGYIGAAQVVGNPQNVKDVKAVFQLEGQVGSFRPNIMVPTVTDKVSGNPERAKGVGVSAVIQFRI
jgi:hypothetical protein